MLEYSIPETAAGFVGLVLSARGLARVYLPLSRRSALVEQMEEENPFARENSRAAPELCREVVRYFEGQPVTFHTRFDWSAASEFDAAVWRACFRIPYGRTLSYKQLAEKAGRPRAARAVGMAMRRNRCPLIVPCHRVLASGGGIGGYSGAGGVELKRCLLQIEQRAVTPV